uniref:Variant surface glycoprotein 1125.4165 n=1 Tax=Trypanosoma brucei TaxID=5691 RepID=A0A1J0RA62_9TRYP|nr:variant surface glycoprotein 1125.4165 [Trypanosoma brucei]
MNSSSRQRRSTFNRYIAPAVAVLLQIIPQSAIQQLSPAVLGDINTVCKEATYFTVSSDQYVHKLQQLSSELTSTQIQTKVWQFAAARTAPGQEKAFYTALISYANRRQDEAARMTRTAITSVGAALEAAAKHAGYLNGREHAVDMLAAATLSGNPTAAGATCTHAVSQAPSAYSSCTHQTLEDAGFKNNDLDIFGTSHVKISKHTDLKALTRTANVVTKIAGSTLTSNTGGKCQDNSATGMTDVQLSLQLTKDDSLSTAASKLKNHGTARDSCRQKPEQQQVDANEDKLERLICEAQQAVAKAKLDITGLDVAALQADEVMLEATNNLAMGNERVGDPTKREGKEAVAKKIPALAGDPTTFYATFVSEHNKQKVTFKKAGKTTEEKSLEDIAKSDDFGIAVSYFEGQSMLAIADAATKTCKPELTETEATCAARGAGDDCKSPCKLVEEEGGKNRCTLDKEEAKKLEEKTEQKDGGDSKTTNTTGSNSFVISKGSLWLAYLIL